MDDNLVTILPNPNNGTFTINININPLNKVGAKVFFSLFCFKIPIIKKM